MRKYWIGILLLLAGLLLPCEVRGQNFEEEFNTFLRQNEQSFNRFKDSINRKFAAAMEANMRAFTGEQPKVRDYKPKPDKLPQVEGREKPSNLPQSLFHAPEQETGVANPDPQPESPYQDVGTTPAEQFNWLDFDLFGADVRIVRKAFPERLGGFSARSVSDFWIQLSECDYEPLLQICRAARIEKNFNDWATYQLILELARQTYPRLYDEQAVMVVFLLNQLGMEAKVGFGNAHLFCLLAVEQQLYGLSFVDIANTRYYLFEVDPAYLNRENTFAFHTYDISFPECTRGLDVSMEKPLKSEKFQAVDDSTIVINMNMIELFRTYPQVDIEIYANSRPSDVFCKSIDHILRNYLESQTEYEAVSFLLAYMHYGFEYATDEVQFGFEKPFFCEENYYYLMNDCEDRAVLFSFLVRYLLDLDVVLVDYPGHIATAVHFHNNVPGKYIEYNGLKYMICDPTYIGAHIGEEMPEYAPADRTIIPLK